MKRPGSGRNYARGRGAEYRAAGFLRARGYSVVRSAKSHGPADLLAGRDGGVLAVQVKGGARGLARFSQKDRAAFIRFAGAFGAVPVARGPGGAWFMVFNSNGRADLVPLVDGWF